jgi:hypothetical protein
MAKSTAQLAEGFLPCTASAMRIDKFAHVFNCVTEEHGGAAVNGFAALLEYSELVVARPAPRLEHEVRLPRVENEGDIRALVHNMLHDVGTRNGGSGRQDEFHRLGLRPDARRDRQQQHRVNGQDPFRGQPPLHREISDTVNVTRTGCRWLPGTPVSTSWPNRSHNWLGLCEGRLTQTYNFHGCRFMRRSRSAKRGSERYGFIAAWHIPPWLA